MLSSRGPSARRRRGFAVAGVVTTLVLGGVAKADYVPGEPPAVDPGTPVFAGLADPVPPEPVAYDPAKNMMQAVYDADSAAGGTSYWMDSILQRPFLNAAGETSLLTRGRALYMYNHTPGTLGFAGGYAYRERPSSTGAPQNLYTIALTGTPLAETTAERVQYPSYFQSTFTGTGVKVAERKFITYNNTAVTELTLTNTGTDPATKTLTVSSPVVTTASGDELRGSVTIRYGLTTVTPRLSGSGFTPSGTTLTRDVTLDPGASVTLKVQMGMIAAELPDSATEYERYKGYDNDTAWKTQMAEYNRWWTDNVPYVDLPNDNVKKLSYYRTWENRFNSFDGNIPGNDYQFPVDLEGALGYNNQISLTVPMRLQDLEWWRDPLQSYGPWLSQGEESGCQAFHDNPGNTANWNNTYEQWTAEEAFDSYEVHGGPRSVLRNLAHYAECDVKGTLAKFDTNHNGLIEYSSGTLPGNDADSVAFQQYGTRPQDRTETSFWYSGAKTAAQEYALLGDTAKADELDGIADNIRSSVMSNLWASGPQGGGGGGQATGPRVAGKLGNAVKLSGSGDYVSLPTGAVSGLTGDFTISTWVNLGARTTWSRVFDFGSGTTANMFLTVSSGTTPRFAITTSGGGGEQQINGTAALPTNGWVHLAVTVSGTTGTLYVNGTPVGTNANLTLHPSSLGNTTQNWIGRSQYGDPLLNATVDDFNVYSRALSASEVADLAGGTAAGAGDVADYKFDEPT